MEWNKEDTVLLIEYFKERRELWDSTSEHFKDRHKKHEAWMYLASKFNTERSVVEKKMRNLIGQFQRELKKCRSGAGAEEITSKWFAFELLLFLKDKTKVRYTYEAGISQDNPQENLTFLKMKKRKFFDGLKAQKEAYDRLQAQKETFDRFQAQNEAHGIKKELQTEPPSRDNFTIFGEYIASRLRNLQDPFTISTVQNQIHNVIYQAEMDLYSGGGANPIGSNSGGASTSFNRGYYTSSLLNSSSGPADSPHTDTDTSQFSEDMDDVCIVKYSPTTGP